MKEIKLRIKDNFDLVLLHNCLNQAQSYARINLAKFKTMNNDIEMPWMKESIDEFDRIMAIKAQILTHLKKIDVCCVKMSGDDHESCNHGNKILIKAIDDIIKRLDE